MNNLDCIKNTRTSCMDFELCNLKIKNDFWIVQFKKKIKKKLLLDGITRKLKIISRLYNCKFFFLKKVLDPGYIIRKTFRVLNGTFQK